MTILEFKDLIKNLSLAHKDVKTFDYGSDFDIAVDKNDVYPMIFLELPFLCEYAVEVNHHYDEVTIALNVLVNIAQDNIDADFMAINYAKNIGDIIIKYINEEIDEIKIQSASSVSLREFSDDSVAGMRYDLVVLLPRVCVDDWNEVFDTSKL